MNTTEPTGVPELLLQHEDYGLPLAFTFNPNPAKYHSYDPVVQYKQLLICIFRYARIAKTFYKFVFTPELTIQGNIHIHGVYYVKNKYEYNKWFLPACKKWGYIKIKNRVDTNWLVYMRKSLADMKELLYEDEDGQRLPVPITKKKLRRYKPIMKVTYVRPSYYNGKKIKKTKITDYM